LAIVNPSVALVLYVTVNTVIKDMIYLISLIKNTGECQLMQNPQN
jgi:hypothetical protein